jgi:hypothetical protein
MNKYFKFTVESDLGAGTQYIEFDEDNWAIRQAECHEGRWFNSSRKKYHPELGGIALFDQQLTELGIQRGEQIDAKQFESAWKLSNRAFVPSQISSTKESRNIINRPRRERPSRECYVRGRLNELRIRLSDLRRKLSIETSDEIQVILERKIQQKEKLIKFIEYKKLKKSLIRKQVTRSKESPR